MLFRFPELEPPIFIRIVGHTVKKHFTYYVRGWHHIYRVIVEPSEYLARAPHKTRHWVLSTMHQHHPDLEDATAQYAKVIQAMTRPSAVLCSFRLGGQEIRVRVLQRVASCDEHLSSAIRMGSFLLSYSLLGSLSMAFGTAGRPSCLQLEHRQDTVIYNLRAEP